MLALEASPKRSSGTAERRPQRASASGSRRLPIATRFWRSSVRCELAMTKLASVVLPLLALALAVPLACDESGTHAADYTTTLQAISTAAQTKHTTFATRADELVASLRTLEAT